MSLTILNTNVRLMDGLYSLNDLHKAAGGLKTHQPANFLRTDQANELIKELCSSEVRNIPTKTIQGKGKDQGTYVCRELVYAYAMWISPKFHLHVIRTFDRLVQEQIENQTKVIGTQAEQIGALTKPASLYAELAKSDSDLLISEAAMVLKVRQRDFFRKLADDLGWIYRRGDRWLPNSKPLEAGLVARRRHSYKGEGGVEKHGYQTVITERGLAAAQLRLAA